MVTANAYLADPKNPNPGTVSVFVNNGDSKLQPKLDYRPGKFPRSVAIADLNGDGKPDLATANVDDNTASVFLNRGDGGYDPKRDYLAGAGPRWVAIGDLNNDGRPDLVTANTGSLRVSVLLNKGDGNFRAPRSYPVGDRPYAVAIGDLNGDRKPDLATANQCSDTPVSVFENRGDGSFEERLNYRRFLSRVGRDRRPERRPPERSGDGELRRQQRLCTRQQPGSLHGPVCCTDGPRGGEADNDPRQLQGREDPAGLSSSGGRAG